MGGQVSIPDQSVWDFSWTKCYRDCSFSPVSIIVSLVSILIFKSSCTDANRRILLRRWIKTLFSRVPCGLIDRSYDLVGKQHPVFPIAGRPWDRSVTSRHGQFRCVFSKEERAVLCIRGHSAKHGHHGTISHKISHVRIFTFPFLKTVSVRHAAEGGCYLVTKINFGPIGLMCTKFVSHYATMFIA